MNSHKYFCNTEQIYIMSASMELYDVEFKTMYFENPRILIYPSKELLVNLFVHSRGSFFISNLKEDGWRWIINHASDVAPSITVRLI